MVRGVRFVNGSAAADGREFRGTPVFKGTRVPVRTMFECLADSLSLDDFLESFPTVRRELAVVYRNATPPMRQAPASGTIVTEACAERRSSWRSCQWVDQA